MVKKSKSYRSYLENWCLWSLGFHSWCRFRRAYERLVKDENITPSWHLWTWWTWSGFFSTFNHPKYSASWWRQERFGCYTKIDYRNTQRPSYSATWWRQARFSWSNEVRFYHHIEERCLPYCRWVLSFCCHGSEYKEGFNCADGFTRTQYFTKTKYFYPFDILKFVASWPTTTYFVLTNKNVLLNVTETLCGFPFLRRGCILFHLMSQIVANHRYRFNTNHSEDIHKEGCTCADEFTTTGFTFLHRGCILFHVMRRLVANHRYQFHNKHSEDFQRIVNHRRSSPLDIVKLNYSTEFFIHTIGGIVQHSHHIATAFNNNGSTTIGTSRPCAVSAGVWHDSFACPKLLSAPVSSVTSSFVNSSTFASESGGGTHTQPQITQAMKTATQPQAIKTTSTMTSMATTRVAKAESATVNGKADNSAMQIVMQMRYPTIRSAPQAITIRSVLKSIEKFTSKSDLHLLRIDIHNIFGYLWIDHNNPIDSPEQIEVKEEKIQDIKVKDEKDEQDIQEEAKAQPRIICKCLRINRIVCDLYLLRIGFDYHRITLLQIFCAFRINFNIRIEVTSKIQVKIQEEVTSKIQMKIKEEGTSLMYLQKFQKKTLTSSIYARYIEVLRIDINIYVELKVEVQHIQSTVEMNWFYCLFFNDEAEDLIVLSSITLKYQPNKERVYLDTLQRSRMDYGTYSSNRSISSYSFENTKSRITEKVKSKIQAKAKSIDDSITLENPSESERYLKIECLQFDSLIQVGWPRDSIVIHDVLRLNWQPVFRFYGARYWKSHIVCCGINNNNNTSILVQSIEVENGVVNETNDIPLPYIRPLFHCGDHTLTYVHKHVDGVPHFNKITFTRVFLEMKNIIAETTISLMEMTFSNVHVVISAPIRPIAVFAKAKHCSTMILTELLQSHLACNSWFRRKPILANSWFHRTAVIATSTTYDYRLIDFLRLQLSQLTAVPGKGNSLLHLIHEYVNPLHADDNYSPTDY